MERDNSTVSRLRGGGFTIQEYRRSRVKTHIVPALTLFNHFAATCCKSALRHDRWALGLAILKLSTLGLLATALGSVFSRVIPFSQNTWGLLFSDHFDDGKAAAWALVPGWTVEADGGNYVLSGSGHAPFASTGNSFWYDYRVTLKIKPLAGGTHINFRVNTAGTFSRYFLAMHPGGFSLNKQIGNEFQNGLVNVPMAIAQGVWHTLEISCEGIHVEAVLDGRQLLSFDDRNRPLLRGIISLETLPDSHVHFDDVEITGQPVPDVPEWNQTHGPDGGIVRAFAQSAFSGTLFVGAPNAGIFRSTDGGRIWQKSNKGLGNAGFIFHIQPDPVEPGVVYAVFVYGGVFQSVDDGETWNSINKGLTDEKPYSIAVDSTDNRMLYLGTQDGKIFKSTDRGNSWIKKSAGLPTDVAFSVSKIVISPENPSIVYASTGWWDDSPGIGIFRSTDAGETWKPTNTGLSTITFSTVAMKPGNPQILFAAGTQNFGGPPIQGGGIFKTSDGGDRWTQVLGDNQTAGCGQAVAVAVSPRDPETAVAGVGSCIFKSSDGGEKWQRLQDVPTIPIVTHLAVDRIGTVYVTGYYGGVSISYDNAASWVYSTLGFNATRIHGMAVDSSDTNVLYAGTRGDGEFKTTDGGRTWKRFEMGLDFFGGSAWAVDPRDSGIVYAGTYYSYPGRVYKTGDAGMSWRKVLDTKQTVSFGDQKFINCIVVDRLNPQTVFAAVLESGIFKSTDGGETWKLVNKGLGSLYVTSLFIHPRESRTVYAGALKGGVFKSTDGGESWLAVNTGITDTDIWSLAINLSNPETLYAGSGNPNGATAPGTSIPAQPGKGKIFKSTDGGQHWSLVYGSSGDSIWAIIVDPVNSETIYAAEGGMLMSADGGANWVEGGRLIYDKDNSTVPPFIRSLAMDDAGNTLYAGTIEGGVFRTVLRRAAGVSLGSSPNQSVDPGGKVIYSYLLRNTGNIADTFDLTAQSSQGWSVSAARSVGSVNYGEEVRVEVQVSVPPGASVGAVDNLSLKATSRFDPKKAASAQALTTIVEPGQVSGTVVQELDLPLAGAIVRVRGTASTVTSDESGHFELSGITGTVDLTAAKPGYYTAGISAMKGQNNLYVKLRPLPPDGNQDYRWLSYLPNWKVPNNCGNCHLPLVQDWLADAHSKSAVNPRFINLYSGTDARGRRNVFPGLKLDLPGESGNCALCHAPVAAASGPLGADMNALTEPQKEGVSCDFCHKIFDVLVHPTSRLPDVDRPGIKSMVLKRPAAPGQVFFGPLGDVPDPDSFLPLQRKSTYCAPCHTASFSGTPIYQSYSEWLASPYATQGVECQDCHMPPTGITNFAPGQGGLRRAPETLPGHYMPGAADVGLLQKTVALDVVTSGQGDSIAVKVALTNTGAGHHVPTDHPMRNMILAVTARDRNGQLLPFRGQEVVPAWGGDYSGLPGKGYAKILADAKTGEAPVVSYWKPTRVISDTRIPALACDRSTYEFAAPSGGGEVQVDVQVVFRRTFQSLADAKGWNVSDIIMAERKLLLLTGAGAKSSADITVPVGGAGSASTPAGNRLQVGYAGLVVTSGAAPYGTAVFSLTQHGVVVSEAAVPASSPTTAARVLIDYRTGVPTRDNQPDSKKIDIYTGLALANGGVTTANLTFRMRNPSGTVLATGHGVLSQNAHAALFINDLKRLAPDFVLPPDFPTAVGYATLDIGSDQPISILALRMAATDRDETLMTTTPVADLTTPSISSPLFFPQFADGGGFRTSLFLMNTSASSESGTVRLFGRTGSPVTTHLVGDPSGPSSAFTYTIPSGGFSVLNTDGLPASVNTGWIQITPSGGTTTPVGAGIFSYAPAGVLLTESGIPSATPTKHARIYIDRSSGHSTGLAIAAPGTEPLNVVLRAYGIDGVTLAGSSSLPLAANGQEAKFDHQLIPALPADFTGVLDISSTLPFVALTMRSLINARGDFLLTTFPVADADRLAPSPIFFPQVADGEGYRTEFILISAAGPAKASLTFFADRASP
jgi:photosystem II stability/assembly factor-like uncharacterized protein